MPERTPPTHDENQWQALADELPVLVSFVGKDERYRLVNKAYEAWFGHPRAWFVGRTVLEVIGPQAYAVLGPHVRRALAGELFSFEQYGVPYREGGVRDVKVTFVPRRSPDGEVEGYATLLEDVTERRRLERERDDLLASQAEALAHRAELERQLLGVASHDLRGPLQTITVAATTLARQGTADPRLTRLIRDAAQRAARLVSDLLDLAVSRFGGSMVSHRRPADLAAVAQHAVDEITTATPDCTIELRVVGNTTGSWDADRLSQVLHNLIGNACKYGAPGRPICISVQGDAEHVTLAVRNEGAPIPTEQLPRIFDAYEHGDAAAGAEQRSVGLGLFIVHKIVEAHGGSTQVASTPEAGTTFTVRLPRASARRAPQEP